MFWKLFALFTIVPAIELYLLFQIGQVLGIVETVLIILVTGSLGAALAKREGLGVLTQLQADTRKGIPPANRLVEGLLVLVGGVLLITPGVFTDLAGFLLILPPTRRFLAPRVKDAVVKRFTIRSFGIGAPPPPAPGGPAPGERRHVGDAPSAAPAEGAPRGFEHPVQDG